MNVEYIIGLTIILLIFWNRFIRTFSNLIFSQIIEKDYYIILSVFFIGLFSIYIYFLLKNIAKEKTQGIVMHYILSLKIVKTILNFLKMHVIDSPSYFYETLTQNVNLKRFIEMPASYFTAYAEYPRIFVITFYYLPQIIVAGVFVIETCFFNQRIFFYKSLLLLIPYILAKVIIYVFYSYSKRMLTVLDFYLDITREPDAIHVSLKSPEEVPQEYPFEVILKQYNTLFNYFIIYSNINDYMKAIKEFESKYSFYILLITSIMYLIGWLYFLFYLLSNIF